MRVFFCLGVLLLATTAVNGQEKTLDYYINAGIETSPLLKDYAHQVQQNHVDSARLAAGYKTQVNGVSTNSWAPVIGGFGYDGVVTNFANFSELVAASKQLIGKANLQNQYNMLGLQNDSLRVLSKISVKDLQKAITSQYITAYGSWQQYQFNNEVLDLLLKEDTILKRLTQSSVYRQTDYLTFLVTLQQQKLAVLQAKNQYRNDFALLNYVSGLVDTSFIPLTAPAINLYEMTSPESTVFYDKFRIDSLLLKNSDAQIDFNYKPKVNLYADAGYVSSFAYEAYKNFGSSIGINLTVPIYDGRQRKMQHTKIAIAEQTRQGYRDFFKAQYSQQIALLIQQLNATQQLIDETSAQLKYVQSLIEANGRLLATGDVHIADYIIAINNYLNAKNIILQNTISKLQIITQINYWSRQ
ncbi:MAG TPA: TolC family protein [Chitinophagaceae bacterium]|nr:TolC family protein [Chitinophagaceae bacterium]